MLFRPRRDRRRGREADADLSWLAALCDRLRLAFEAGTADVTRLSAEQGDGWEAAAREARYDFLRLTAERVGARWIATGHTRDDQIETIVHRIARGTGRFNRVRATGIWHGKGPSGLCSGTWSAERAHDPDGKDNPT